MFALLWPEIGFEDSLTYDLLLLTIASIFFVRKKSLSYGLFLATVVVGIVFNRLSILGASSIAILIISAYAYSREDIRTFLKPVLFLLIAAISYGLFTHSIPGFLNLQVLKDVSISDDAVPYTLWLNFDKPAIAVALLLAFRHAAPEKLSEWWRLLRASLLITVSGLVIIIPLVLLFSNIQFVPKLPSSSGLWLLNMLFFVCVAEEVFFRRFLQHEVQKGLSSLKHSQYIALVITSILFALVHLAGGVIFVGFAFIAGLIYGYAYIKSGRVEGAIFSHFILNSVHFFLFSYPNAL